MTLINALCASLLTAAIIPTFAIGQTSGSSSVPVAEETGTAHAVRTFTSANDVSRYGARETLTSETVSVYNEADSTWTMGASSYIEPERVGVDPTQEPASTQDTTPKQQDTATKDADRQDTTAAKTGDSQPAAGSQQGSETAKDDAQAQETAETITTSTPAATGDSGNAYAWGQCTWWAYERRKQLGLPVGSYFGNGAQWASSAANLGYTVDNTPGVGSIIVFQPGQAGASLYYGHVGVVEQVHDDGSITISESNAQGLGVVSYRTLADTRLYQYIH